MARQEGPESVFLWVAPRAHADPMEARREGTGKHFAISLLVCLTGSLAAGGQGLGTAGCTPDAARAMALKVRAALQGRCA